MHIINSTRKRIIQSDYTTILKSGTKFFITGMALMCGIYGYCILGSTMTVIKRINLEKDIKQLTSNIGKQELSYLNSQKNLSKDYALNNGFVEPNQIAFTASRSTVALNAGF